MNDNKVKKYCGECPLRGNTCVGADRGWCIMPKSTFETGFPPVEVGDIILAPQGVCVVECILDNDRVSLRALVGGLDDKYPMRRPPRGMAWALLARGSDRYEPGTRHVR